MVGRHGKSSLRVEQFRDDGKSFDDASRRDPERFGIHGASFRILLRGTGCVGTVAFSALPQLDDHRLVVDALTALLGDVRSPTSQLAGRMVSAPAGPRPSPLRPPPC